jgi:hypothetical protein
MSSFAGHYSRSLDNKNSFCHLKLIEKMSFYLNFRVHKGSVLKTGTVFGTALMTEIPAFRFAPAGMTD